MNREFMQIILLIVIFNLGLIIWRKSKLGLMLDPIYNGILITDFFLSVYGFMEQNSLHSFVAWLSIVIFVIAIIIPFVLSGFVRRAISKADWSKAHFWLGIIRYLQPSIVIDLQIKKINSLKKAYEGNVEEIEKEILKEIKQSTEPEKTIFLRKTLLELYVFSARWDKAIRIYKQYLLPIGFLQPEILSSMVRAGFETANYELMWDSYLRIADNSEENKFAIEEKALFLLESQIIILSAYGKTQSLKEFIKNTKTKNIFPKEVLKYWIGISLLINNKRNKAKKYLTFTKTQSKKYPVLVKTATQKLKTEHFSKPPNLTDEQKLQLNFIVQDISLASSITKQDIPKPMATYVFILICIIAYITELRYGGTSNPETLYMLGANFRHLLFKGEWWRGITAMFLHANFIHILFNVYAIWLFGQFVEKYAGTFKTWSILIVSGFAGNLASAFYYGRGISIGASSSAFGILGASLLFLIIDKQKWDDEWRRSQISSLFFLIIINLIIGFSMPMIDNAAHVGGFVGGFTLALIFFILQNNWLAKIVTSLLFWATTLVTVFSIGHAVKITTNPQYKSVEFKEVGMKIKIPESWEFKKDNIRGEYAQSLFCSLIPTFRVIKGNNVDSLSMKKQKEISISKDKTIKFLSETDTTKWKKEKYLYKIKNIKGYIEIFYKKKINSNKINLAFVFMYDDKCAKNMKKHIKTIVLKNF